MRQKIVLHLKSNNIIQDDKIFEDLIQNKEFKGKLLKARVFKKENRAIYKVLIYPASLIAFKKKFDQVCSWEIFELFEFREW